MIDFDEIKPAAYLWKTGVFDGKPEVLGVGFNQSTSVNVALYTRQQLIPPVSFTREEASEFRDFYNNYAGSYTALNALKLLETGKKGLYPELADKFVSKSDRDILVNMSNEEDFVRLWSGDLDNLILIEDKRWYVRSSSSDVNDVYGWLDTISDQVPTYNYSELPLKDSVYFDTKEEAQEWCTPNTVPVLLAIGKGGKLYYEV